jgi:hypothetical protein
MYPTFADLLNDLLGTSFCLPIQTFGFFVALAFISAWATLRHELIRKSKSGLFPQKTIQVSVGGPIPTSEIGYSILIWGIMGYKLGLVFTQNNLFCDSPQAAILSLQGDPIIAAIAAALGGILKYREYQQKKNHKAEIKSTQTGGAFDGRLDGLSVGMEGVAVSDIKPFGKASIQGEWYEVKSETGFIEVGKTLVISKIEHNKITVK